MKKKILTSKDFIELILNRESKKIVGKVCKRIELVNIQSTDSKEMVDEKIVNMKLNIKELLYEWTRDVRDMILGSGLTFKIVDNTSKEEK